MIMIYWTQLVVLYQFIIQKGRLGAFLPTWTRCPGCTQFNTLSKVMCLFTELLPIHWNYCFSLELFFFPLKFALSACWSFFCNRFFFVFFGVSFLYGLWSFYPFPPLTGTHRIPTAHLLGRLDRPYWVTGYLKESDIIIITLSSNTIYF